MNIHIFLAVASALVLCLASASILEHTNNYMLSLVFMLVAVVIGRYAGKELDRINK